MILRKSAQSFLAKRPDLSTNLIPDHRGTQPNENHENYCCSRYFKLSASFAPNSLNLISDKFCRNDAQEQKVAKNENEEVPVVSIAEAIIYKRTVMIKELSTSTTEKAVEASLTFY